MPRGTCWKGKLEKAKVEYIIHASTIYFSILSGCLLQFQWQSRRIAFNKSLNISNTHVPYLFFFVLFSGTFFLVVQNVGWGFSTTSASYNHRKLPPFYFQNVLAIGDSRLFWNWLSLTADVGNREQQWHEFLFLVYPVVSWAISV